MHTPPLRRLALILLLLLPILHTATFTTDALELKLTADAKEVDNQLKLEITVIPLFYDVERLPSGKVITEEKPLNIPIHITVEDESGNGVASCSPTASHPITLGSRTFYKAVCQLTLPKGCYIVKAHAEYSADTLLKADTSTAVCKEMVGQYDAFATALGLDNPSFYLNPQCFFLFTVFMLALLSLAYRGIGLHKVFDITYPKVPSKVFTFKYGYTIYHMGKEIKEYREKIKEIADNLRENFPTLLDRVTATMLGSRIYNLLGSHDQLLQQLGAGSEQLRHLILGILYGRHITEGKDINTLFNELTREMEQVANRGGNVAQYLHNKALEVAEALRRRRHQGELVGLLSFFLGSAALIVSEDLMKSTPKPKAHFFTANKLYKNTVLRLVNFIKGGAPEHQGKAISYPAKQLLSDHVAEGLLASARLIRSLPGFKELSTWAYKRSPTLQEWLKGAMGAKELGWKERLILSIYGYHPEYPMPHTTPLENAERLSEAVFNEMKMDMGKRLLLEYMNSYMDHLKAKGVDLGELERSLKSADPEHFEEYAKALATTLEKLQALEEQGALDELISNIQTFSRQLKEASSEEEVLKVLEAIRDETARWGDTANMDAFLSVVGEAFSRSQEFDVYTGKVNAVYETFNEHRDTLESFGVWKEGEESKNILGKFLVSLFGELSLQVDKRLSLSEALLAANIFLFERNFGVGAPEEVGEHIAKRIEEVGKKSMRGKAAREIGERVGESVARGVDIFYETVARYLSKKGVDITKDQVPAFLLKGSVRDVNGNTLSFEEVLDRANLEGLRAFYHDLYLPRFQVGEVKGAEFTDAYQSYPTAASHVIGAIDVSFGGSSEEPFTYAFSTALTRTFSDLVAYSSRTGFLTPEGKNRFERVGEMLHHYLALAAYTKAYEELGYWTDRLVQDKIKDEKALVNKAKEIMEKSSPEELIKYLEEIKWEIPLELSKYIPFIHGPEGAIPHFFTLEGGAVGTPILINKEALLRLSKDKSKVAREGVEKMAEEKAREVVMKSTRERDRSFVGAVFYYIGRDGRLKQLSLRPEGPLYAKAFLDAVEEGGSKWGLTREEREALKRALEMAYSEYDPQQKRWVSVYERMAELQRAIEQAQSKEEREALRAQLEALTKTPPRVNEALLRQVPLETLVSALRKVEQAVVEGQVALEGTWRLPWKQMIGYEEFSKIVATLSVATERNLFTRLDRVVVGHNPSLKRRLALMWEKFNFNLGRIEDWVMLPSFLVGAAGEYFKQRMNRYLYAVATASGPNTRVYADVTRYRTIQGYIIENLLKPNIGVYEEILRREAQSRLGYVPEPTFRGALQDLLRFRGRRPAYFDSDVLRFRALLSNLRRWRNTVNEVEVMAMWQVPRNEFLMSFHPSPESPHVALSTGYHMGPLVGYSAWYSTYIYHYFPIQKFLGSIPYEMQGWTSFLSMQYPRSYAEYISKYGGKKGTWKAVKERLLQPGLYYVGAGTIMPALLPTVFMRGIMGSIQSYLITASLTLGMHMARARRIFGAAFRYPAYQDYIMEYNEEALEKLVEKALRRYTAQTSSKEREEARRRVALYLSYINPYRRSHLLSQYAAHLPQDELNALMAYLQQENVLPTMKDNRIIPPIMRQPPWVGRGRPASPEEQYYVYTTRAKAYGLLFGEMVKNAFPIYLGAVAPFFSYAGVGLYSYLRYHAEQGSFAQRLKGFKPSHAGYHTVGFPTHIYEGIKLPPYQFRWYIPGIGGFHEKTIGHGYFHGMTWEMIPEPWVYNRNYAYGGETGFGLRGRPLRPQYHGTDILSIIARQQDYYRFFTSAENVSFAFMHPVFAINYLTHSVLGKKRREWAERRVANKYYKALDVWSPYTPWQEKAKSLIFHPLAETGAAVGMGALAFSGVLPFVGAAAVGAYSAAKKMAEGTTMGKCPACGSPKPKGQACPTCGFKPYSPDF